MLFNKYSEDYQQAAYNQNLLFTGTFRRFNLFQVGDKNVIWHNLIVIDTIIRLRNFRKLQVGYVGSSDFHSKVQNLFLVLKI